jgi:hypothetical protein
MNLWSCGGICAIGLAATACADQDDRIVIGYFEVAATLVEKCADTGLLAAPEQSSLTVHLQRFGTMLHWDHGDGLLLGTFDEVESSFSLEQSLWVDVRESEELPECEIERRLAIQGALRGSAGSYQGFDGAMRHDYVPTETSVCDDLLQGAQPLADALPCAVAFELYAELAD